MSIVVLLFGTSAVGAQPAECNTLGPPAYRPSIWLGHPAPDASDELTARIRVNAFRGGASTPLQRAIAETDLYRVSGDRDALVSGLEELSRVPDATRRPELLIRLAAGHEALGRSLSARETYRRVMNRHPPTMEASIAALRLAILLIDHDELAAAEPLLRHARRHTSLRPVADYFLAWSAPSQARALAALDQAAASGSDVLRAAVAHERCAITARATAIESSGLPEPDWSRARRFAPAPLTRRAWNRCFAAADPEACMMPGDAPGNPGQRDWMSARGCELGSVSACRAALEAGIRARSLDRQMRWLALVWQSPDAHERDRRLAGAALRQRIRAHGRELDPSYRRARHTLPVPLDEDVRRLRAIRLRRPFPEQPSEGEAMYRAFGSPY